jgi:uncharacterized membrane protein YphA (DoxX/SURF4 family)
MTYFGPMALFFGLTVLLVTVSSLLLRDSTRAADAPNTPARIFLVMLRLAIGWHCMFEGLEKINNPAWSSEAYLREAIGPLSGVYRWIAGDRLLDKLRVTADDQVPAALAADYDAYTEAFLAQHALDAEKAQRARDMLKQGKSKALTWLTAETELVEKIAPYPPPLKVEMTFPQRLAEYDRLKNKVDEAERALPSSDKDLHKRYADAKANLNRWRAELQKSYNARFAVFKAELRTAAIQLPHLGTAVVGLAAVPQGQTASLPATAAVAGNGYVPSVPEPVALPITSWGVLEWSDRIVEWSLVIIGAALLVGLFSRVASAAGALLVLSFFLAMPPLPGWPEGPRLEGHYLFINKTLIEVFALAALACIPTGRWAGLDALLHAVRPRNWLRRAPARTVSVAERETAPLVG